MAELTILKKIIPLLLHGLKYLHFSTVPWLPSNLKKERKGFFSFRGKRKIKVEKK
jgi:hypothetical protein